MLGPDGQPLARRYYAEKTGKDLDADEVVRGYEVDKEKFIIVTDEEFEYGGVHGFKGSMGLRDF